MPRPSPRSSALAGRAAPTAPAARQTLTILQFLAHQRGPVAASVIATALELPRSTVYRLLGVLEEHGFVLRFPEVQRYGIGIAAFEMSSGFSRQEPLSRLGRPILAALVDHLGESAHLAVLHGRDVIYLVEERAPRRPALVTDVGVRLPSHLTASGRALLATLPKAQLRALFPTPAAFVTRAFAPSTSTSTSTNPSPVAPSPVAPSPVAPSSGGWDPAPHGDLVSSYGQLTRLLEGVRERGYAGEDGEVTEGFASVAVAVRDHTGWPAAGIAVTFPRQNVSPERWPALAAEIARSAAELSRRIRGRDA
ncbi:IclR family transcriptional regulator [Cryobacterium frigoriphilum]|uniref:IclR family transcriptional regulator n=1 Tax=Cryobacterium frigoriphilum TaxID=1259150 RepID=A0A4R9A8N6_9MICO|nr:IclR family transcriptional regulator [Cryobacterium frigoriphilum]TFD53976.1 IclR family transcriptional regulator [Cryobacterium frigoriphilum]